MFFYTNCGDSTNLFFLICLHKVCSIKITVLIYSFSWKRLPMHVRCMFDAYGPRVPYAAMPRGSAAQTAIYAR